MKRPTKAEVFHTIIETQGVCYMINVLILCYLRACSDGHFRYIRQVGAGQGGGAGERGQRSRPHFLSAQHHARDVIVVDALNYAVTSSLDGQ